MVAVGLVEGPLHVNWKLLTKIALWWVAGFVVVMLTTAAVIAQGNSCPNCHFTLHQSHEWCLKLCVRACVCVHLCVRVCVCVCVCVRMIGGVAKTSEYATGHRRPSCVICVASLDLGLRYMGDGAEHGPLFLVCFIPWLCLGPGAGACSACLPDWLK